MKLNADFSKRIVVHGDQLDWTPSPIPGISRRMLDRIGDEVARATSIVRYDPDSQFSPHVHTGGEEFVVLEGIFQDEHGDYPAGSYIRNPPQSRHTPGSIPGCVIFVKLWQFDLDDRTHVRIRFDKMNGIADHSRPGVSVIPLFKDDREEVRVEDWAPNVELDIDAEDGGEILVLNGSFKEQSDYFYPQSWLRLPTESAATVQAGSDGARVWIKTGHLRYVEIPHDV